LGEGGPGSAKRRKGEREGKMGSQRRGTLAEKGGENSGTGEKSTVQRKKSRGEKERGRSPRVVGGKAQP